MLASNRRPWLRGGLFGPVVLLLPFSWVLEVNSCGGSTQTTEYSGLELVGKIDLEFWLLFFPIVAVSIAMPVISARLTKAPWGAGARSRIAPLHRMLFHILGALAAFAVAYLAFFVMFFTIFNERHPQAAGWLVLALFTAALIDALARLLFSIQEFRQSRKAPA